MAEQEIEGDPSAAPAHALWVELATRVTTQRLHYRSGDEETAAASLHTLFGTVRKLMTDFPAARNFQGYALALLNQKLRPYTARWHGWMTQDRDRVNQDGEPILQFRDEWVRRRFREELRELQPSLLGFQRIFCAMGRGETIDPQWAHAEDHPSLLEQLQKECRAGGQHAELGEPLALGFRPEVILYDANRAGRGKQEISGLIERREAEAILARRQLLQFPAPRSGEAPPSTDGNAAGLALSGGGIRSATFCLGIVQALQKHQLFHQFDYLSTVSGGGYLGTFISSYLGADPAKVDEVESRIEHHRGMRLAQALDTPVPPAPALDAGAASELRKKVLQKLAETFQPGPDESESPPLRYLRNNSRYLLNGGVWGLLRIAGVFLTGFFTSMLMLLTLPLSVAWALRLLKEPATNAFFTRHTWLLAPWERWLYGGPLLGLLGLGILTLWWEVKADAAGWRRALNSGSSAVARAAVIAAAIWLAAGIRSAGLFTVYWRSLQVPPHWDHPSAIALAGVLTLLALLWLVMPLTQRVAEGTRWNSIAANVRSLAESGTLLIAIIAVGIALICAAHPLVLGYENLGHCLHRLLSWKPPEAVTGGLLSLLPLLFGALMKRPDGSVRGWARWLFQLSSAFFFVTAFLIFASNLGIGGKQRWNLKTAAWISGALVAWPFLFINVNTFAPHRYYRNRLCECYLAMHERLQRTWLRRMLDRFFHGVPDPGQTEKCDGVGTLQRLPLTALGTFLAAPYHLINATINAEASKNPTLRGRNGDFFVFSRQYCGSPLTGYMATQDLEKVDPHVDLGTAMAISGAAASTNMGWQTMRQLRFLLTLFNIRLGYWIRRPGSTALPRPFEGPGPLYFLRELLGAVHEKTRYVNLSDGGHIENLAAYELLRRRCKFIVCVDAGMEPKMQCADLMRLQRYASIDFGIRMHFDPADLTLLPTTYSRAYAILVKIDYGSTADRISEGTSRQIGWMLYLKLAVTGTEPRYVLDYRRQNPAFPHQTTADQFYDEAQFEAYRALGECAAESLFRQEIAGDLALDGLHLQAWFQALADNLLPDNDPAFSQPEA